MLAIQHTELWKEVQKAAAGGSRAWMLALAVIAAPLCEEFIFRGLIYGGLRRSMNALPALARGGLLLSVR